MKKRVAVLFLGTSLLLAGCHASGGMFDRLLLNRSDILNDAGYRQYQEMKERGELGEDGTFADVSLLISGPALAEDSGVRVSLGENRYLKIQYYQDAAFAQPLNTGRVEAGVPVYGKLVKVENPYSDLYEFQSYRVLTYNEAGKVISSQDCVPGEDGLICHTPETGSISILPLGSYRDRTLNLEAFRKEDSGTVEVLPMAGVWYANDQLCTGSNSNISPVESYTLKYDYDERFYFFVRSEPMCFHSDNKAGTVEFFDSNSTAPVSSYSVELHKYLNLSLQCEAAAEIRTEDGTVSVKKGKTWSSSDLKYGDEIRIETAGDVTITAGDYRHIQAVSYPLADGKTLYILTVTEDYADSRAEAVHAVIGVNRLFEVQLDTACDHGKCTYELDGKEVSGLTPVREGQKLELIYTITDGTAFAEASSGLTGGIVDFWQSHVTSPERTVEITITPELEGTVIRPDSYVSITEKTEG